MSVALSKAGPYFASGPISFGDLRRNFRAQARKESSGVSETFDGNDVGPISASTLRRNTDVTDTNPIVPDATENAAISTGNDWVVSQFRNTIKYFYYTQTGTDLNLDIDALNWNSNLDKNIRKFLLQEGTLGSDNPGIAAGLFDATSHNFTIDVHAEVYGGHGRGGGTAYATAAGFPITGQTGGTGLSITNVGNNFIVNVRSTAKLYAGGGGGERGKNGNTGSGGWCSFPSNYQNCGGCPGCPGGWRSGNCWTGGGCRNRQKCNWWGNCWRVTSAWTHYRTCYNEYSVSGGSAGAGGVGGSGQGYGNLLNPGGGVTGDPGGANNGCGSTNGTKGEDGGPGGVFAAAGGDTLNTGTGGVPGPAVTGSNYTVTGNINSSTLKGNYPAP